MFEDLAPKLPAVDSDFSNLPHILRLVENYLFDKTQKSSLLKEHLKVIKIEELPYGQWVVSLHSTSQWWLLCKLEQGVYTPLVGKMHLLPLLPSKLLQIVPVTKGVIPIPPLKLLVESDNGRDLAKLLEEGTSHLSKDQSLLSIY